MADADKGRRRSPYTALRQKIQPYWRPRPPRSERIAAKEAKAAADEKVKADERALPASANGDRTVKGVRLTNVSTPLDKAASFKTKPGLGRIWFYEEPGKKMQVFAHFDVKDGYRFPERDDSERKRLKPRMYPTDRQFDRTHLIPIGYHGSESADRLLVGWDSFQNRKDMLAFEKAAKALPFPIYWLTSINRTPKGANWHYRVYNAIDPDNPALVKRLDLEMEAPISWRT